MKLKLFSFFSFASLFVSAQNIQLHYDFGKPETGPAREFFVSTFEFFSPDSLGSIFLFADFEFDSRYPSKGVSSGYFEISREFYMPWFRNSKSLRELALHAEYNGGSAIYTPDTVTYGLNLTKSWLAGFGYPLHIGNFTLNSMVLYKYVPDASSPDFQLTLAWFHMLFKNRVTLSGFVDVWTADNISDNKDFVVYAEPQVWFNAYHKFSIGSEFKISKNFFPGSERIEVFPTLGLKYSF
jgi:hypothetical protein